MAAAMFCVFGEKAAGKAMLGLGANCGCS
jgi:hypothetical protein